MKFEGAPGKVPANDYEDGSQDESVELGEPEMTEGTRLEYKTKLKKDVEALLEVIEKTKPANDDEEKPGDLHEAA